MIIDKNNNEICIGDTFENAIFDYCMDRKLKHINIRVDNKYVGYYEKNKKSIKYNILRRDRFSKYASNNIDVILKNDNTNMTDLYFQHIIQYICLVPYNADEVLYSEHNYCIKCKYSSDNEYKNTYLIFLPAAIYYNVQTPQDLKLEERFHDGYEKKYEILERDDELHYIKIKLKKCFSNALVILKFRNYKHYIPYRIDSYKFGWMQIFSKNPYQNMLNCKNEHKDVSVRNISIGRRRRGTLDAYHKNIPFLDEWKELLYIKNNYFDSQEPYPFGRMDKIIESLEYVHDNSLNTFASIRCLVITYCCVRPRIPLRTFAKIINVFIDKIKIDVLSA